MPRPDAPLVVLKLGGSLFSLGDLPRRLERVLLQRDGWRVLLVCGGGEAADIVRRWQPHFNLDDDAAHWLALRAVTLNEALLAAILPGAVVVDGDAGAQRAWEASQRPVLCAERFVRRAEPECEQPLPHNWDVTSDSIAAWVAQRFAADELLLAKSLDLPPGLTAAAAARERRIDAHLPRLLADWGTGSPPSSPAVSWVNLRSEGLSIQRWLPPVDRSRSPASNHRES